VSSLPNSNGGIEKTVIKDEEDPLLITFKDMEGKVEVYIYVCLSKLHRDMHEYMVSPTCSSVCM
jgi:hypothetical protein